MGKHSYTYEDEIPKALRKNREVPRATKNSDELPKALRYNSNNSSRNSSNKKRKKKKKKKRILLKIFIILIIVLAVIAGGIFWLIQDKLGKINYVDINKDGLEISSNVPSDYRNIAILAVDSRDINANEGSRSDGIIILSVNEKTKDAKLISVYRDTYVEVPDHGLTKITHAFAYGGPELAIKTLNRNLDLNISEFVAVNFESVASAIDTMGGVEIEIKDYEVEEMNLYIAETAEITGREENFLPGPGVYNLDGVQATTYGRIRQVGNGDYERTERMRTVIEKTFDKAKHMDLITLNNVVDEILPKVQTNISGNDIVGLMLQIGSYNIAENQGWPYETRGITLDAWYGIPVTLESNVEQLHKEIFGQQDYVVPETVKDISSQISNRTGYYQ